jgi:hypothetical protein
MRKSRKQKAESIRRLRRLHGLKHEQGIPRVAKAQSRAEISQRFQRYFQYSTDAFSPGLPERNPGLKLANAFSVIVALQG